VTKPTWCQQAVIATIDGDRNYINTIVPFGDTLTSSHDFDGNGRSDILWRDTGGNTEVWLMNGAQVASVGTIGNIASFGSVVGQRDFNGDGKADLLVRDPASGATAIWLMNGTQVVPNQMLNIGPVGSDWTVVGTGQFDVSGITNQLGLGGILWQDTLGNLSLWLMDASRAPKDGLIRSTGSYGPVDPAVWSIVGMGDFNGDFKTDILWRKNNGDLAIWFMDGVGPAQPAGIGGLDTAWSVVGTGDFDGDGKFDILLRKTDGSTVIWFMNGAVVKPTSGGIVSPDTTWSVAQTGDYDFDGKSDIIWRKTNGDTSIWLMDGLNIKSSGGFNKDPIWTIQSTNAE
jgi:FG-GAP-like repeat/FG-GAP repeat